MRNLNRGKMSCNIAGKFIVLDGPDGCGKSTQTKMLRELLAGRGITVTTYRDPGTTVIGEKIREILLDPAHEQMGDNTETLLYMAARAQLWQEKIGPDLADGKCVIMDRWISSTCAYQGCAGNFGIQKVIDLAEACLEHVWPDVTIVLDVDLATAAERMDRELDRMEQKPAEYHEKVRQGFLQLAKQYADKVRVVDATQPIDLVSSEVTRIIEGVL